ncbi:hypothetical protein VNO78_06829 [Psophocarpus tetragonolobus]|uniref:Neprosin PEP catalytic domain-containing protein n=1 Tax=Psophocarpus tetragonolobus TaxID=3891 RepID=A0AAN9XSF9_PSOTE
MGKGTLSTRVRKKVQLEDIKVNVCIYAFDFDFLYLNGHTLLQENLRVRRETEFGYIVDCIDIKKQPAFDHPLLKNHKLQRKPSFQKSNNKTSVKNSPSRILFELEKDECPKGTVPIRRTTKDDLIRTKSTLNNSMLMESLMESEPGLHMAELTLIPDSGPYYKISGINSIYNPTVLNNNQISASNLWVRNGPIATNNKIVLGWHKDNFKKTGCINMLCRGFVQVNKGTYLGLRVNRTSIYGGPAREFEFSISQDVSTKNWWLMLGNIGFGYYPRELFSNLTSADHVGLGGRTRTAPNAASPQMGSGHFPDRDISHSCYYFRNISYHDKSRTNFVPERYETTSFTDNSNCFGVEYRGFPGNVGYFLQFGGPGGNCGK